MRAVRIHQFGPPEVVVLEEVPVPAPGAGEALVRVAAAGVAPWDALIREGKSKVSPQPPLTLGSDLAGVVESVGDGVTEFKPGDEIYGVTNPQFVGAQAEYAVAQVGMIARKPQGLSFLEAASAPVVAITAWQMLFEYAQAKRGQTMMILGAAGSVGMYAVQMAMHAGVGVVAVVRMRDAGMLRSLGVTAIVDADAVDTGTKLAAADAILDLVGGDMAQRCLRALKPGGKVVSVVSDRPLPNWPEVHAAFFYAEVTTLRLDKLTELFEARKITARVGSVLPLAQARHAHEMLAGAPHNPGKVVLEVMQNRWSPIPGAHTARV
jgi:NADPH:quinone reductase-like Zn-dependent oxidoreductase